MFATEPDFFWAPVKSSDDLLWILQFTHVGALIEVPDGDSTAPARSRPQRTLQEHRGSPALGCFRTWVNTPKRSSANWAEPIRSAHWPSEGVIRAFSVALRRG